MLLENMTYPADPRVSREARALHADGYRVTVIAPGGPGQRSLEVVDGVHVYRFPAPAPADGLIGYLWEYGYSMVMMFFLSLLVLFREGFDVIHAANPPDTMVFIAVFYKLLGKRFVFDHHDLSPEMYHARFQGRGNALVAQALVWLERISCRLADHVIVTNESYRQVDMQRSGVPTSRISVVRNGPDLSRLRAVAPDPELRALGRTIIGYVGVTGSQDGVDYLLRSLSHLAHDHCRTDFLCIIVGGGDALDNLKQLATELGLNPYVRFTGWLTDPEHVARYLSSADICVAPEPSNPYNDRSTMIKITEYMAMGRPIVAFDLPEHRFTAGDSALYARPNDERAFTDALAQLMDDPEQRSAMGTRGRQRIEAELAWSHSVPHLLRSYKALFQQ